MEKFTFLWSSIVSTVNEINTRLTKDWAAIDRPSIIWMSDLSDKKTQIFPSIGRIHTTLWMDHTEKKAWRQLHKNVQNYAEHIQEATSHKKTAIQLRTSHLKTIQIRRIRHAGHCERSKNELKSDVLQWTPSHGRTSVGWPANDLSTTGLSDDV